MAINFFGKILLFFFNIIWQYHKIIQTYIKNSLIIKNMSFVLSQKIWTSCYIRYGYNFFQQKKIGVMHVGLFSESPQGPFPFFE